MKTPLIIAICLIGVAYCSEEIKAFMKAQFEVLFLFIFLTLISRDYLFTVEEYIRL